MTTTVEAGVQAPGAGPRWPVDWDRVLDSSISAWGGEWTTGRVQLLYKARYGDGMHRADARAFLSCRARQGLLRLINRPDARSYTPTTRKDRTK